ncbi:4Fe-4S binding protein [Clostridium sp. AT4]|uniref:4Fe-4S binding protein n=1 Tax=Clostridium sp. AT4 TaxID=1720194 RepID=UPI0008348B61|nr:4Fe-4S binding protein [Clostridium sp. AT4]
MATGVRKKRKASVDSRLCVACGCCVKVCPLGAIYVAGGMWAQVNLEKCVGCYVAGGMWAQVNLEKCVGCGKCAKECPASVIEIREVG